MEAVNVYENKKNDSVMMKDYRCILLNNQLYFANS